MSGSLAQFVIASSHSSFRPDAPGFAHSVISCRDMERALGLMMLSDIV